MNVHAIRLRNWFHAVQCIHSSFGGERNLGVKTFYAFPLLVLLVVGEREGKYEELRQR